MLINRTKKHSQNTISWVSLYLSLRFGDSSWRYKMWVTLRRRDTISQRHKEEKTSPNMWRNMFKQTKSWKTWMQAKIIVWLRRENKIADSIRSNWRSEARL